MKEIKDIIRAYEEAALQGKQTALATVVHLDGSAYRRPGARMLITEDGQLTGAISGGCLEGDALRKAQLVMVQKKPMLVKYDTTDEDDAKLGVGLGCNGIISILIEPIIDSAGNDPISFLKVASSKRQYCTLVTAFSYDRNMEQPGTCLLLTGEGEIHAALDDPSLKSTLITDAREVLEKRVSITKQYGQDSALTAFVELIAPPVSVVILGAGNDSIPLVHMAKILGWETTVVDGRPNYATIQRFPSADKIIVSKPEQAFQQLSFDTNTVALLMTHNYNYDLAALRGLLPHHLPYIGALGPKKKLDRMLDELKEKGVQVTDGPTNVFGPTGLDIGAETAEEIALSIVSEIQAVLRKKAGSSLRDKEETIHSREVQQIVHAPLMSML